MQKSQEIYLATIQQLRLRYSSEQSVVAIDKEDFDHTWYTNIVEACAEIMDKEYPNRAFGNIIRKRMETL